MRSTSIAKKTPLYPGCLLYCSAAAAAELKVPSPLYTHEMPLSFTSNEHPDYGVLQVQMHFTTRLRYQDAADLKGELKKQKPICCLSANIMQPLTNSCQQKDGAGFDIASPVLGRVSALQQFQDSHAHDTHHKIGEAAMCSEQNVNYYTDIFTGQLVTNCNSCIDTEPKAIFTKYAVTK